jgi:hypothetical protein
VIRHGPHTKRLLQQLYSFVCIRCRSKVFTEPLPSNDRRIHTLMGGMYDIRTKFHKDWYRYSKVEGGRGDSQRQWSHKPFIILNKERRLNSNVDSDNDNLQNEKPFWFWLWLFSYLFHIFYYEAFGFWEPPLVEWKFGSRLCCLESLLFTDWRSPHYCKSKQLWSIHWMFFKIFVQRSTTQLFRWSLGRI